jgi:hypothetical protein
MAFTAIKYVFNQSNRRIEVVNKRTGESTNGSVAPQDGRSINTWVEWCRDQNEFNQSHLIEVRLYVDEGEDIVFALWQHARQDGDYVRYSLNLEKPVFSPDAPPVPGNGARAGGDRVLRVINDNNILLDISGAPASFVAELTSEESDQAYFKFG